jgi:general secretion pathway protein D
MRSKLAKLGDLQVLPIVGWVVALTLALLFCRGSKGQNAPQFPALAQYSPAASASESKVEAYPLNPSTREVLTAWQQRAAGRTDLRVAIDERTSQALVYASPAVHALIQQELAAKNANVVQPGVTPPTVAPPTIAAAVPAGPALHRLRQLPPGEVRSRLEGVLSRQLPATVDASGEWQTFQVEASPGISVSMSVNTRMGQVRIDGPPAQVAAWKSVIEALDSPPTADNKVTKLIATKSVNKERVRQALEVLKADGASRPQDAALLAALLQQGAQSGAAAAPQAGAPAGAAPNQQQPTTQMITPGGAQTAAEAAKLAEASGLLGPVQVEFVEGLDVIVLRGSERDVERVMKIIKQIEDLSAITVPTIQIYPLKNVDSVRMAALMQGLYSQPQLQRFGVVTFTPLGKPNAILLIGRAENVKMAIELIDRLDQQALPTARFEVFQLKHAQASEAKTLIDGFLGQAGQQAPEAPVAPTRGGGTTTTPTGTGGAGALAPALPTLEPRALVVADPRTNSLIVSASPRDLAEIAALVVRIDTPGAAAEMKVITIVNGDAEALANMLRSLFSVPSQPQGGGGGGGGAAQAEGGGGLGQGGPVRMQFSVDQRTNSIIAVGSREDLAVVEAILLRLDQGDLRERVTKVYKLNNAKAEDVSNALNGWLQTQRQAEQQVDVTITPFQQIEREVVVVFDAATNSLIVSATPRFYKEVVDIIRQLDERPPMVLIQVLIAQVQLDDTDQFGVELGLQDSVLFDRSLLNNTDLVSQSITNTSPNGVQTTTQNIISATGNPGFNFNSGQALGNNVSSNLNPAAISTAGRVGAQALSNFAVGRTSDLGFGGFVFSASSDAVSVLLRALQEKRHLEVLSRPQLMALDGQYATVQVGQDVPIIQNVSLTTFGQTNSVTYRQAGLILNVQPRISPDGLVVMQIAANKSQVSADAGTPIFVSAGGQVVTQPRFDVAQAQTTISALSGQTVILGGLIETTKSDVHRRVPIIADIPLLGDLFRYDSVAEQRRELLIVLTPQIIYNKMDSDLVKQIESSRMSWILSDVINVHGEAGLRSRCDEWYDGEMESVFPNFVPEEGFLPLSSGHMAPTCEPTLNAPNCPPPASETPPPVQADGKMPEPRQSPTSNRPANDRYGAGQTSEGVRQVQYLAPPLQLPSASGQ